ncbi:hypothetical protein S40288_05221 [Stachybotrys chartarum IBT 40288]|nr:hypothetical protein S40288_05221 [Stachybotrys chartarum IBT 40288]
MDRDKLHSLRGSHSVSSASPVPMEPEIDPREPIEVEEPGLPEGQRERRGESLWRVLSERQINMIAFSGTVGNGLFLGSGRSIASAGPGGAVVSYLLIGTIISSVISCLGEMTALMPVNAPMMEFPRRFLDRGIGFAVGWIYWFAYAVLAANQLVAVSNTVKFRYDDGTTFLSWRTGEEVDHAVWFIVFLILVTLFNLLRVKIYGDLEYMFGCVKMSFIVMLILMMFILARENAYYDEPLGTKYWNDPYSFFNPTYHVAGEQERDISGPTGTLLGVWTTFINVMFSYVGMDIVAATAAESRALSDPESMKMAARKLNLRIITLYSLAVLTSGFVVPYNHPFLNGGGQSVGSRSVFVIAVVEAGMPAIAHFFNAMFVFSSCTCAINSMYVASRVLHTLALRGQTGPDFITSRLKQCRSGVPMRTVFVTAAVMLIGLMGRSGSPGARLDELANNCTVSCLIVYCTICATYLYFYKALKDAQLYGNASEAQAASYDRNNPLYPYKSHAQWLKASYGLVTCMILIIFNGVGAFLETPFNARNFVSSYISLPVFILLVIGYKIRNHGFRLSQWRFERSEDLGNTVQVLSETRKGRLEFPDEKISKDNIATLIGWIWRDRPYHLVDTDVPQIREKELLVKVHAAGFCHSDLQVITGECPAVYPLIPSHEGAGTVALVGSKSAGNWKIGDRVGALNVKNACGTCPSCALLLRRRGKLDPRFCENRETAGFMNNGCFAEYMVADAATTLALPDSLPFDQAAPLMCAGVTIWGALEKATADLQSGDAVAIVGTGGLGYLGIQFCRALGFHTIAIDNKKVALELTKEIPGNLGPDVVVDSSKPQDASKEIHELTRGEGLAAAVVCTDSLEANEWTLGLLRAGGTMVALGLPPDKWRFDPSTLVFRELTIKGSYVSSIDSAEQMMKVVDEHGIRSHVTKVPFADVASVVDTYQEESFKGRLVVKIAEPSE